LRTPEHSKESPTVSAHLDYAKDPELMVIKEDRVPLIDI
jgi:hypothetical protein